MFKELKETRSKKIKEKYANTSHQIKNTNKEI